MNTLDETYQQLKIKISEYNPNCDFWALDKAYNFSMTAHSGQSRVSGEPFIIHPLHVAHILADIELDNESIVAGLLHDIAEDTIYTTEDIRALFGKTIADLVEGVTKLGKLPYSTKEEQQIENFRKMFLAMAQDIRVVLIKLADRLHNMRTLKSIEREKQLEKAHETMEIFAPLANRLGISRIKWELEDLSLMYLDPDAYRDIANHISINRKDREKYIDQIKSTLKAKLVELGIDAHIEGRAKHFYSIYRKMFTNNIDIDEIYDLLAVRVITKSINECYAVLGLIHELYKPISGRFKDYIAMPKKNMYQSLHTSVIGPTGRPFEIQIRTWKMHRIAEVGIAAHWKYKEGISGKNDIDSKLEWVRQLIDIHSDTANIDADEFMRSVRIDLFEDEVFVFSPKGDVINLPAGAIPIDFAYAIHSAIGNKTTGAKINGRIVPLDYKLQNGDIVEIITTSVPRGPSRDWVKIVKTSQARKKINDWFKKEHREDNIVRGKDMLEKELKRNGLPVTAATKKEWLSLVLKKYNLATVDDLYAGLGYGGIPITKVISRIKEKYRETEKIEEKIPEFIRQPDRKDQNSSGIVVRGVDNCLIRLSRCCNPVPGDNIVGYITRGRGVSVHRKDCINAINLQDTALGEEQRFIDVWWSEGNKSSFYTDIQIVANDRQGLVLETTNIISESTVTMHAINARSTKDSLAIINITLEIKNKEELEKIIKRFWRIKDVISVVRKRQ
ncbi:MAG: bifunctional (p)ppGpp synthetase/guanosine-3',5'-bis(diphosphate) 3'-pyrophosphohydrolase [Clostridiaceae bacterium]|nr:bifunctional (p)ppGpp synthetase/guanosine-3',5'-bis(diphosphate) 3'-pyrophosphohydrolase [Clostridiaceae bacterium]